jgi:Fe-S-cluster-containing dehydrogenase component
MEKSLIFVDIDKCTGCRTCESVCSLKWEGECNPTKSRIKALRYEKFGEYLVNIPVVCQQCETPMCKEVCPVNAINQNQETGAYQVNPDTCIGCRLCTIACPVGVIEVDPNKKIAYKCNLCEGDPLCVKFCLHDAINLIPIEKVGYHTRKRAQEKLAERLIQTGTQESIGPGRLGGT